jgi:hypothetical protein
MLLVHVTHDLVTVDGADMLLNCIEFARSATCYGGSLRKSESTLSLK